MIITWYFAPISFTCARRGRTKPCLIPAVGLKVLKWGFLSFLHAKARIWNIPAQIPRCWPQSGSPVVGSTASTNKALKKCRRRIVLWPKIWLHFKGSRNLYGLFLTAAYWRNESCFVSAGQRTGTLRMSKVSRAISGPNIYFWNIILLLEHQRFVFVLINTSFMLIRNTVFEAG